MKIKEWSFYDPDTGRFIPGVYYGGPEKHLAANTPPGAKAIQGRYDAMSHCVDLETGVVVAIPVAPESAPKPQPKANLVPPRERALARIGHLERQQQRAQREALLKLLPTDHPVRARLKQIDDEISTLRADLTGTLQE